MIRLTPLEETVAGRELIEIGFKQGIKKGMKKGIKKGMLIGKIMVAERMLNPPISSREELEKKSTEELRKMLAEIEAKLS